MKKVVLSAAVLLAAIAGNAQAFQKGVSTVNVGYGIGNIWKSTFNAYGTLATMGGASSKTSVLGPVVVGYDYGLSDKIGLGLQVGYGKVSTKNDYGANSTDEWSLSSLSIMARGTYHFSKSDKFDPYVALGLGYHNFTFEYKEDGKKTDFLGYATPAAFGFTGALGANYYFASNFGAYAEVGYTAGSIFQLGLKAKF